MDLATHPDPFPLDPEATRVVEDGRRLRELGGPNPYPVVLPGNVRAWGVANWAVAKEVFQSKDFRKHPKHWKAFTDGEIPGDWPLLQLIFAGMLATDGLDHRRLRGMVNKAFTPRRVEALRPRIEEITQELIEDLADVGPDTLVDLRQAWAFPLPMRLICHMFGLDLDSGRELAKHYSALHHGDAGLDPAVAHSRLLAGLDALIARKRAEPGDDLTSALIEAADGNRADLAPEAKLAPGELRDILFLFLFAGHDTTQNLMTNVIRALAENPDQLDLVRRGKVTWSAVVKEALRALCPIYTVMFYYAAKDIELPGTTVTIRKGDPVAILPAATGRDTEAYGPGADEFDVTRTDGPPHLAFGWGEHHCVGAPLANMMMDIGLEALYRHYDVDRSGIAAPEPVKSYSSNSDATMWSRLRSRQEALTKA
ncbi:cytochrome P450 [Streptomyces sp. NBC_00624]|uniref:cytochrome P450 n=1 Tax=Streptomyces sp. NBC_00624 TaxID=2975791 RepID=UPI002F90670D